MCAIIPTWARYCIWWFKARKRTSGWTG